MFLEIGVSPWSLKLAIASAIKNLDVESKEAVRVGTFVAVRCFEMTRWMIENGRPCWYETLARKSGHPSVFKLTEAIEIEKINGVYIIKFVQCELGAPTTKPTELMVFVFDTRFLPTECRHDAKWWIIQRSG